MLVAAYCRPNLTLRQLPPLFGVSKSATVRIVNHLGPLLAFKPRKQFRKDAVLIVDAPWCPLATTRWSSGRRTTGTPPTTRSSSTPTPAWSSWWASPLPGSRNDCKAWAESGAKAAVGKTMTIADGGYSGTGLVMPHHAMLGNARLHSLNLAGLATSPTTEPPRPANSKIIYGTSLRHPGRRADTGAVLTTAWARG